MVITNESLTNSKNNNKSPLIGRFNWRAALLPAGFTAII